MGALPCGRTLSEPREPGACVCVCVCTCARVTHAILETGSTRTHTSLGFTRVPTLSGL